MTQAKPKEFNMLPKVINGTIAGVLGVACNFPLDLVKTRLQNQQIGPSGEKMYRNMFDAFIKTVQKEGLLGLYSGSSVILLIGPEKAIKLAANDYFRYQFMRPDGHIPMSLQGVAGALAGVVHIILTTPLEFLKIQMQDAGRVAAKNQTKAEEISTFSMAIRLLRERGILAFYKGFVATACRDVNFAALYFPLFAYLNSFGPRKKDGSNDAVIWCSFAAGFGASAFTALVVTPFDVVKTRLQAINKAKGEVVFKGIADCFVQTYKREGFRALFKGGLCRMIVIAPLFAIAQAVYYIGVAEYLLGVKKDTQ